MEFKDRLKTAMQLRHMKSVDLVEKTGLDKARISQYINGVYIPKSKATFVIAEALDVSVHYLMGEIDEPGHFTSYSANSVHHIPQIQAMVTLMENASEDEMNKIVAIVKTMLGK